MNMVSPRAVFVPGKDTLLCVEINLFTGFQAEGVAFNNSGRQAAALQKRIRDVFQQQGKKLVRRSADYYIHLKTRLWR